MKLTKHQIQFIDKYLANSGVRYADIRFEMTDHIATMLESKEGDFYYNFKEYMLKHKKELLNSNSKFIRLAGRRATKILLTGLIKPATLVVFALVFVAAKILHQYLGEETFTDAITSVYLLAGICFVIYYRFYRKARSTKYSVVDKLQAIVPTSLYVVLVFIRPERIFDNVLILITFYSFFTAFMVSTIISYRKLICKYKLQYNE